MSHRSELAPIPSVTTMVNVFEIRKQQNRVGFGDLKDLENIFHFNTRQHAQYRLFSNGNYSVSLLNYSDAKRVVVIHQENVDPSLVVKKTMQATKGKAKTVVNEWNKTVFGPSDWFCSGRASSAVGWEDQTRKKRRLDQPGGTNVKYGQSESRSMGLNLMWKSDEQVKMNDEEMVSDRERMKQIDLTGSLYFADDFHYDQVQIAYSANGVYKLTLNNTEIGFAMNLSAIIGSSVGYTGILFEDSYIGCFALLVCSSDQVHPLQIWNPSKYFTRNYSCLFDNVYRSFRINGDCIENPYYGSNDATDFAQLPCHICLKILHHLPMAQRVHFRRVSQRWLPMANTALAVDTKNMQTKDQFYSKMRPHQFRSFLPMVAEYLEVLELHLYLTVPASLYTFFTISSFPVLRKLKLDAHSISNVDALLYMLDRSPKLEALQTALPSASPTPNASHGPYAVKKLTVRGYDANDPHMVAFLEYFPNVCSLCIKCKYLTASCISWIMEKYGSKLRAFISLGDRYFYSKIQSSLPFGAATGIQACPNLAHLTLYFTSLISDVFIAALAAGCHKLETLNLSYSLELTNERLTALAVLPNLTWLNISGCRQELNEGMTAIARAGRLTELKARRVVLSSACLKTIVSHCRHLTLLDIRDGGALTMDDATEIIRLYGMRSMERCFILRSRHKIWRSLNVHQAIDEIRKTNRRYFQIQ